MIREQDSSGTDSSLQVRQENTAYMAHIVWESHTIMGHTLNRKHVAQSMTQAIPIAFACPVIAGTLHLIIEWQ